MTCAYMNGLTLITTLDIIYKIIKFSYARTSDSFISIRHNMFISIDEPGKYLIRLYGGTTTYINCDKGDTTGMILKDHRKAGITKILAHDGEVYDLYPYITYILDVKSQGYITGYLLPIETGLFNKRSDNPQPKAYLTILKIA